MHCYTVFKLTGTHADTLAAIGAAGALRHLGPRIVELEDRFEIRLPRRPTVSDLDAVGPGFAYLEREKKTQAMSEPAKLRRRGTASPAPSVACAFPTDDRRYAILARLKAYAGPNRVVLRYAGMPRDDWARALWRAFEGRREFVCSFPLVQLFNPHAACGYSLLKPRGTRRGDKTKNRWAEPFHEWLRFRGYFDGCAGWFASSDLRLFCPIPGDIAYEQFAALAGSFRELRLGGTGMKMDCRAVLCLTRFLIQDAPMYRPRDPKATHQLARASMEYPRQPHWRANATNAAASKARPREWARVSSSAFRRPANPLHACSGCWNPARETMSLGDSDHLPTMCGVSLFPSSHINSRTVSLGARSETCFSVHGLVKTPGSSTVMSVSR